MHLCQFVVDYEVRSINSIHCISLTIIFLDSSSDHESINSQIITGKPTTPTSSSSSSDGSDEVFSYDLPQITTENAVEPMQVVSLIQGIKRKLVDYDDSESDNENEKKEEQKIPKSIARKQSKKKKKTVTMTTTTTNDSDQPIALRRAKRTTRRSLFARNSQDSSSSNNRSLSEVRKTSM